MSTTTIGTHHVATGQRRAGRRRRPWPGSTSGGVPPTTCRSGRSTSWTTRCCASRSRATTSSRGCSGHWGTTPGLNFLYAHLNRAIAERNQSTIYIIGPGHGGPGLVASAYLDGTYSEFYSDITEDAEGMHRLFRQFSFPGGIPSHVAPETPGSIHEGGELGYALCHAYGAAFDNPDLLVATIVGDGEAETGPLATSWHSNKFVNVEKDGVVLPILHLNGYKIANPTVLARISDDELDSLMVGLRAQAARVRRGLRRRVARRASTRRFATLLDEVLDEIAEIKRSAHAGSEQRPHVADDRVPHPQGLDRAGLHRRQEDDRLVARAPGAAGQRAGHPGAPRRAAAAGSSSYRVNELFDEDGTAARRHPRAGARRASCG